MYFFQGNLINVKYRKHKMKVVPRLAAVLYPSVSIYEVVTRAMAHIGDNLIKDLLKYFLTLLKYY